MLSAVLVSCKKDQKIEPVANEPKIVPQGNNNVTTDVVFNFNALVGTMPLGPTKTWYVNENGDNYTVTKFNYYISNIKITRDDGTVFSEEESYHVIKHIEGAKSFTAHNMPEGVYKQIEFTIGVDSIRNVSGAQTGALSPDSLMFWGWSTGYIFFKLEGSFQTLNSTPGALYAMHVGGFSGPNNCLRKCSFNLVNKLILKAGVTPKVFYNVDVNEIFSHPKIIDLNSYFVITGGVQGKTLADNYMDMFTIDHIEN